MFDYDTCIHLRNLSDPALENPSDITLSGNILFVAEPSSGLIHRVPLNSTEPTRSWTVGNKQLQLSTLKSGNILVMSKNTNKLIEYTTTGQLVRDINLPQGITYPTHAIQMDNDRFLVCHVGNNLHCVCLIDSKGQLIKSYGGARGSGPRQLAYPYYLVADVNGFCLVADYNAHRIILLNSGVARIFGAQGKTPKFAPQLLPSRSYIHCLYVLWAYFGASKPPTSGADALPALLSLRHCF